MAATTALRRLSLMSRGMAFMRNLIPPDAGNAGTAGERKSLLGLYPSAFTDPDPVIVAGGSPGGVKGLFRGFFGVR